MVDRPPPSLTAATRTRTRLATRASVDAPLLLATPARARGIPATRAPLTAAHACPGACPCIGWPPSSVPGRGHAHARPPPHTPLLAAPPAPATAAPGRPLPHAALPLPARRCTRRTRARAAGGVGASRWASPVATRRRVPAPSRSGPPRRAPCLRRPTPAPATPTRPLRPPGPQTSGAQPLERFNKMNIKK